MSARKILGTSRKPCKNANCTNDLLTSDPHRQCPRCRHRKWARKNRLKRIWLNLRISAKRRDIEFALVPFTRFRDWCYEHSFKPKSYLPRKDRPSIDRICEEEGYTFNNIQVLSVGCNSAKSNADRRIRKGLSTTSPSSLGDAVDDNNPF